MAGHAVPGPLHLTDPAPVEVAAWLGADHVHTATVPLCGCPTARTGLGDDPDGESAGVHCAPPGQSWSVTWSATGLGCLALCVRGGETGAEVGSLLAVQAEHKITISTLHPPTLLVSLPRLEDDAGPTAWLRTEDPARLEDNLLRPKCEISGPLRG